MNKIKTYNVSGIVNNININDNVETISVKKALELVLTKYNLQNLLKETKGINYGFIISVQEVGNSKQNIFKFVYKR